MFYSAAFTIFYIGFLETFTCIWHWSGTSLARPRHETPIRRRRNRISLCVFGTILKLENLRTGIYIHPARNVRVRLLLNRQACQPPFRDTAAERCSTGADSYGGHHSEPACDIIASTASMSKFSVSSVTSKVIGKFKSCAKARMTRWVNLSIVEISKAA